MKWVKENLFKDVKETTAAKILKKFKSEAFKSAELINRDITGRLTSLKLNYKPYR